MKTPFLLPIVVLIAAGCANLKSAEQLQSEETSRVAHGFYVQHANGFGYEKLEAELRRRDVFTSEEWRLIEANRVDLGMSKDAVLASVGPPHSRGGHKSNELGQWETWRYRGGPLITFEGGKVTSIDR